MRSGDRGSSKRVHTTWTDDTDDDREQVSSSTRLHWRCCPGEGVREEHAWCLCKHDLHIAKIGIKNECWLENYMSTYGKPCYDSLVHERVVPVHSIFRLMRNTLPAQNEISTSMVGLWSRERRTWSRMRTTTRDMAQTERALFKESFEITSLIAVWYQRVLYLMKFCIKPREGKLTLHEIHELNLFSFCVIESYVNGNVVAEKLTLCYASSINNHEPITSRKMKIFRNLC